MMQISLSVCNKSTKWIHTIQIIGLRKFIQFARHVHIHICIQGMRGRFNSTVFVLTLEQNNKLLSSISVNVLLCKSIPSFSFVLQFRNLILYLNYKSIYRCLYSEQIELLNIISQSKISHLYKFHKIKSKLIILFIFRKY